MGAATDLAWLHAQRVLHGGQCDRLSDQESRRLLASLGAGRGIWMLSNAAAGWPSQPARSVLLMLKKNFHVQIDKHIRPSPQLPYTTSERGSNLQAPPDTNYLMYQPHSQTAPSSG